MRCLVLVIAVLACAVGEAAAETPNAVAPVFNGASTNTIEATVYENQATFNGGAYGELCIGNLLTTTTTRRSYVVYTLPVIPAGATVTRVQMTFTQIAVRTMGGPLAATLQLRRVTSAWTEGAGGTNTRSCGGGTSSAGVTWNTAPTVVAADSASAALTSVAGSSVTFDTDVGTANDALISDVQSWVNGVANNGWRVVIAEEATINNARSVDPGTLTVSWTLPDGQTCTVDSDCTNNSCVHSDGMDCAGRAGCVCCNAATCSGVCESCQLAGTVGTCAARPTTTTCRAASCAAGVETLATTCDGILHTCPAATTNDCSPYTCNGAQCSTSCQMTSECDPGTFCNASHVCEVIADECMQALDDCVALATCTDPSVAAGDFVCICPSGYSGDGHGGTGTGCTEVDECATGVHDCNINATCTNTAGGFTCACNAPYWTGDGHDCTDVDECATGGSCGANEVCMNQVGAPNTCECAPGFSRSSATEPCVSDTEEPKPEPGGCCQSNSAGTNLPAGLFVALLWLRRRHRPR